MNDGSPCNFLLVAQLPDLLTSQVCVASHGMPSRQSRRPSPNGDSRNQRDCAPSMAERSPAVTSRTIDGPRFAPTAKVILLSSGRLIAIVGHMPSVRREVPSLLYLMLDRIKQVRLVVCGVGAGLVCRYCHLVPLSLQWKNT